MGLVRVEEGIYLTGELRRASRVLEACQLGKPYQHRVKL